MYHSFHGLGNQIKYMFHLSFPTIQRELAEQQKQLYLTSAELTELEGAIDELFGSHSLLSSPSSLSSLESLPSQPDWRKTKTKKYYHLFSLRNTHLVNILIQCFFMAKMIWDTKCKIDRLKHKHSCKIIHTGWFGTCCLQGCSCSEICLLTDTEVINMRWCSVIDNNGCENGYRTRWFVK